MPPLCRAPFPDPVASWLFKAKNWSKEPESRGSADTAAVGGGAAQECMRGMRGTMGMERRQGTEKWLPQVSPNTAPPPAASVWMTSMSPHTSTPPETWSGLVPSNA